MGTKNTKVANTNTTLVTQQGQALDIKRDTGFKRICKRFVRYGSYLLLRCLFFPNVRLVEPQELLSWFLTYEKANLIHDPIDSRKQNPIGEPNGEHNVIDENSNTQIQTTNPITNTCTHTYLPFLIFDARRPDEYQQSHIHGAINLPHSRVLFRKRSRASMDKRIYECFNGPVNKDITIVCYCAVGLRSGLLCQRLKRKGFKDVRILKAGYYGWANEGYPIYAKDAITNSVKAEHFLAGMILDGGLRKRAQELEKEALENQQPQVSGAPQIDTQPEIVSEPNDSMKTQ